MPMPADPTNTHAAADSGASASPGTLTAPETATPPTILVVDDDASMRLIVRHVLEAFGATVYEAVSGRDALAVAPAMAAARGPDLVVLDVGLPDMDGAAVCRAFRTWSRAPVLVLSGRHSEAEKVRLLDAGADDYLTKPFGAGELAARVRARIRAAGVRGAPSPTVRHGPVRVGDLVLDVDGRVATRAGRELHLTRIEWEILRTLAVRAGEVLSHQDIFDTVWGQPFGDAVKSVRVHVTNLRRKIERVPSAPELIVTVRRDGYQLVAAAGG
ncbi:MAG TPA: response regulator transcription factor [Gemmatirosa sp.]